MEKKSSSQPRKRVRTEGEEGPGPPLLPQPALASPTNDATVNPSAKMSPMQLEQQDRLQQQEQELQHCIQQPQQAAPLSPLPNQNQSAGKAGEGDKELMERSETDSGAAKVSAGEAAQPFAPVSATTPPIFSFCSTGVSSVFSAQSAHAALLDLLNQACQQSQPPQVAAHSSSSTPGPGIQQLPSESGSGSLPLAFNVQQNSNDTFPGTQSTPTTARQLAASLTPQQLAVQLSALQQSGLLGAPWGVSMPVSTPPFSSPGVSATLQTPTSSQSPEVALTGWLASAIPQALPEAQWVSEQQQQQQQQLQGASTQISQEGLEWAQMAPWMPMLPWSQYKGENSQSHVPDALQGAETKPHAPDDKQSPPLGSENILSSSEERKQSGLSIEGKASPSAEAKQGKAAPHAEALTQPSDHQAAAQAQAQEGKPKPDPMHLQEFFADPEKFNSSAEILHCPINAEGDTVLYVAAKSGNALAVEILVRASVKTLDWQNHKGITALSAAAHKGRESIVRTLLDAGADVNIESNNGSTPLIQASHFGHRKVVQMVIEAGAAVDRPNNKGTTALMRAAQEGNLGVVEYLLTAGADVNSRNNERMTALMLGSQRGHAPVVDLLLKNGAEVDAQTAQGSTALMLACKRGHVDVVFTLLSAGAEINMKDSRGHTARDTAARRQHQKILSLLQHDKQMRLMQAVVMRERTYLLAKLWYLVNQGRAALKTSDPAHQLQLQHPVAPVDAASNSSLTPRSQQSQPVSLNLPTQTLWRSLGLSQPLFRHIVEFLPLPRLWETTLVKLRRRCHIDPNEAIRGGLKIIDEILTDLLISRDHVQEMHLVRLARDESVARYLKEDLKMPELLFGWLTQESDVQSIMARVERGVTFYPPIAKQVVAIASELHRWYKCHENSKVYSTDIYSTDMPSSGSFFYVSAADDEGNAQLNDMDEESSDDDGEE